MHVRTSSLRAILSAAVLLATATPAGAQAWAYPSFQAPSTTREYNFALADADNAGTSLLFQWRAPRGTRTQLSLDIGFADTQNDGVLFFGGQFGHQLARATADMPLDAMLTVGANLGLNDDFNIFRVPVGVSLGHRFPLEGGLALTPYVHPRLVIANCGDCGGEDDTDIGLEFDLGADFQFSPQFSLRLSAMFAGDDSFGDDAFGISLAWKPGRR